jgi:hypothetical protein
VKVGVIADYVATGRHVTRQLRVGGDPASLKKEGGSDFRSVKDFQNSLEVAGRAVAAVGVLGVHGESH